MPDDRRVQELLDELHDQDLTPEEVCSHDPELLPIVRERWRQISRARDELDAMFSAQPQGAGMTFPADGLHLPRVTGYEVDALLGRGGMGVVFRARHLQLNRWVALKMMLAGSYAGRRDRERFRREAEAIAALQHPNIVQIHDVGEFEGVPFFSMGLVGGGDLARRLSGVPLPAREAASLLATLADAVHAAHRGGIVHRDLKPANILFASDGTPQITDFGLARRLEGSAGLTLSGAPLGTPSYMAPEQARGEPAGAGPAVDVYALGAILYEMLTGRPPFRAETPAETILQVIDQEPVPPTSLQAKIPHDLQTICLKYLQKNPSRRYPSAADLGADLRRFLDGEPIVARRVGLLERSILWIRRRPGLSASIALAGGLLITSLWLAEERAGVMRRRDADRAAAERAAADDLREMGDRLGEKSWTRAREALERASGRLGEGQGVPPTLRRALEQGRRDLTMLARLDDTQSRMALGEGAFFEADEDPYAKAFHWYGSGRTNEPAEVVAARIRASDLRGALVDALDVWSVAWLISAKGRVTEQKSWVLQVASLADPDRSPWVALARDLRHRQDRKALERLCETAPVDAPIVSLLVSLALDLRHAGGDPIPFLKRVQEAHPGDFWANVYLANVLIRASRDEEAIRFAQAAIAIRPNISLGYGCLGSALSFTGRRPEAIRAFRAGLRHDPGSLVIQGNLGRALFFDGQPQEAIAHLAECLRLSPQSWGLHFQLGDCLAYSDRPEEALVEYRRSIALDSKRKEPRLGLRRLLHRLGRREEAGAAWAEQIGADPGNPNVWDGYAEYCLFLGRPSDYRNARRQLLARFEETVEFREAERIGRACLLLPANAEETRRAVALIDRAIAEAETPSRAWVLPFFHFAEGLSEYRRERYDRALRILRGDAAGVLKPGPQLVEAMVLHRSGRGDEARRTLASAVQGYDWKEPGAEDRDAWIFHTLRREAEELIGANAASKVD